MLESILSDPTIAFDHGAPRRVVSLVPSMTASLNDLGIIDVLVGISDFCPHPAAGSLAYQRVGGTKNPRVEEIIALQPDLILANREENSRQAVETLAKAGIAVWLTFPVTVQDAIKDLWTIANLFRSDTALRQVDLLEKGVEWAQMAAQGVTPRSYFCPIWQDRLESGENWWMTFNEQTYPNDVLKMLGCKNIFAGRNRRYPLMADLKMAGYEADKEPEGGRDTRYPRVSFHEIIAHQPDMILLPSEPYPYRQEDVEIIRNIFHETPAVQSGRVFIFDGSLITWHGTRLARALEELPILLSN